MTQKRRRLPEESNLGSFGGSVLRPHSWDDDFPEERDETPEPEQSEDDYEGIKRFRDEVDK